LKLARNLLTDDGVIFISIDDGEVHNLRKLCDEVFGEENCVAQFVWIKKKKGSHLSKTSRSMTEYAICFTKNIGRVELFGEKAYSDKLQPLAKRTNSKKRLCFIANIVQTNLANGHYSAKRYGNGTSALDFVTPFVVEDGVIKTKLLVEGPFVWGQDKLDEEIKLGTIVKLSTKFGFNVLRSDQSEKIKRPSTLIDAKAGVGTNEDAYQEIKKIFDVEGIINYPKPVSYIKYLTNTITYFDKKAIILDFFAGSATTAHAVMQLNAEDGGNRKFIMVQLPEPCDEKSEAFKAGYNTIAEIGKERIRKAGKKIKEENALMTLNLDIGFRVLKVDSSNMQDVYYNPDDYSQDLLSKIADNIKPDRTDEDLLFQVLLDWGVDLSLPVSKKKIADNDVFFVSDKALVACFAKNGEITEDFCKELAKYKPLRVVFRDSGFKDDSMKINVEQIFKLLSPHTEIKTI